MRPAIRVRTNGHAHQNPMDAMGGREACGGRPPKRVGQVAGRRSSPKPIDSLGCHGREGGLPDRGVTWAQPRQRPRTFGFLPRTADPARRPWQTARSPPSPIPTSRHPTRDSDSPCERAAVASPTLQADRPKPISFRLSPTRRGPDVPKPNREKETRWANARPRTTSTKKTNESCMTGEFADGIKVLAPVLRIESQPNWLGSSSENNRLPRTK